MTVARILATKGRGVVTTLPERTLQEVSVELMRHGIGALVVVDANDDIVGLISERDVVVAVAYHGPDALLDAVARHMTANPRAATEDDTVGSTMETMTLERQRHLPVVNNGLLVAGFAISARSMTSRCNNSICGDIDRGGQNSNCFEGRNDEKPEMAADSNEAEFRAFPAICLTASEHRQPGPGAETAFA